MKKNNRRKKIFNFIQEKEQQQKRKKIFNFILIIWTRDLGCPCLVPTSSKQFFCLFHEIIFFSNSSLLFCFKKSKYFKWFSSFFMFKNMFFQAIFFFLYECLKIIVSNNSLFNFFQVIFFIFSSFLKVKFFRRFSFYVKKNNFMNLFSSFSKNERTWLNPQINLLFLQLWWFWWWFWLNFCRQIKLASSSLQLASL